MEKSAAKADLSPKTARKYIKEGKLPSQMKKPRQYRTRPDPFERDWDELAAMLRDAPELEAKT
ncbi:MAG: IS21 family transposase, partial [Myxococcota bacterium]